jgi:hypothetical protein
VSRLRLGALGLVVLCLLMWPAAAAAKGPPGGGGGGPGNGGGGGGGGGSSTPTGNDVSYPQCSKRLRLPSSPAFAIVGVNGGLANDLNPCFGPSTTYPSYGQSELYWAVADSVGGTTEAKVQLYVNTADPGNIYNGTLIADWPTSGASPYGDCTTTTVTTDSGPATAGENSTACAWVYGNQRALQDIAWLADAAAQINSQSPPDPVSGTASDYPWWLDVETVNSWQTGPDGQAMNVADLEGMLAAFGDSGAHGVGVYSTGSQWDQVVGATPASFANAPDWVPGATSLSDAQAACTTLAPFTGGGVAITQWTSNVDGDFAC